MLWDKEELISLFYEPGDAVPDDDTLVLVKLRNGDIRATPEKAREYGWRWLPGDDDIVAYRVC